MTTTEPPRTSMDLAGSPGFVAMYVQTTEDPEPGFDAELAGKVLGHIEDTDRCWRLYRATKDQQVRPLHLWDQTDWRKVLAPRSDTACGTAMCFAGWVAQLDGRWMLEPQDLAGINLALLPYASTMQNLVLAGDYPQAFLQSTVSSWLDRVDEAVAARPHYFPSAEKPAALMRERVLARQASAEKPAALLRERVLARHDPDTSVMEVRDWAAWRLGLGSDPMRLFSSTHGLEELRFVIETYTEHGTAPDALDYLSPERRRRFMDLEDVEP